MRLPIFLFLFLTSCAHIPTFDQSQDDYWQNLVLKIEAGTKSLGVILEQTDPSLLNQIKSDATDSKLLSLWGESLNFDSGAKKKIINDKILNNLQDFFGLTSDNYIVHAGITHSYGYLFSNLDTPYGHKRKRWINLEVCNAFSLKNKSLSPQTKNGTLLSNITYFAGRIVFKNKQSITNLDKLKNVSPEIKQFDYSKLTIKTLEEKILSPSIYKTIIRSHFVKFQNSAVATENSYLLIYSIEDYLSHEEKLITAFPISKTSYLQTTDPMLMGEDRPIQVKYNMHLSIGNDVRLSGKRKFY